MEWCFLFVSRLLVSCIHCTQLLGSPSSLLTLSPSPCRPMAASSMNILPAALFSAVPSRCAWRVPLIEWRSNSHNFQTGLNVNGHYAQCSMLIYIILQNGAVVGWPFFFRFFYFIFFLLQSFYIFFILCDSIQSYFADGIVQILLFLHALHCSNAFTAYCGCGDEDV